MLCDFHLHTAFSGDSNTPPDRQIERAIALGMPRVCVTDHHDMDIHSTCDFNLALPDYFPAMEGLRDRYQKQIQMEIGMELGLQTHILAKLDDVARNYPFDFIIGSCHVIDGFDPYLPEYFESRTASDAYRRFFEITLKRVQAIDCFDSLGHLDYIARYRPHGYPKYRYQDDQDLIDLILKTLIEKGKALECNTGGFRYGLGHPNPCEEILCRYHSLGGELLTIGSDAHTPDYIGYEFSRTSALLQHCGFSFYTVYHQRKPTFLPL